MGLFDWLGDLWDDYIGWWTGDKPRRDPLNPSSPVNSLPDSLANPDPAKTINDGIDSAVDRLNDAVNGAENALNNFFGGIADWFGGIADWFGGIGDWIQANWWLIAIIVVLFGILYFGRGGGLGVGGGGVDDRDTKVIVTNKFYSGKVTEGKKKYGPSNLYFERKGKR